MRARDVRDASIGRENLLLGGDAERDVRPPRPPEGADGDRGPRQHRERRVPGGLPRPPPRGHRGGGAGIRVHRPLEDRPGTAGGGHPPPPSLPRPPTHPPPPPAPP